VPNTHSLSAEHRRHDRLLVARFAVGDAAFGQEHEAQELVRRCSECAALAADISAISKSVASMPAPPRTRDFRLTQDQAASLRGSRLDRWLRTITGSGWSTVRPVAAVALSVGMVMSVVGFLPVIGAAGGGPAGTNLAYAPSSGQDGQSVEPPMERTGVPVPAPSQEMASMGPDGKVGVSSAESPPSGNMDNAYLTQETGAPEAGGGPNGFGAAVPGTGSSVRDLVLMSGLAVTLAALLILALLYAARRRYYDPLLR
jgi:hypothetical protein